MRKKIAALTASLLLCLTCTAPVQPVLAVEGETEPITCFSDSGFNVNCREYYVWANVTCSNLVPLEDGGWMRVQTFWERKDQVHIEYYDAAFHLTDRFCVPKMLPDYGAFYRGSDGFYYLITGDSKTTPAGESPKFDIAKYSTDWKMLAHVQTTGDDVIEAFSGGTVRCADDGKRLIIHTARKMQSGHQSNYSMELDMESMKLTYEGGGRAYVSHSFNQFVLLDQGDIVMLNQGDFYPRSVVLNRLSASGRSGRVDMVYYGDMGDADTDDMRLVNYTGVAVGGFVQSSTHYIVAYNEINPERWYEIAEQRDRRSAETARNVRIAAVPKDDLHAESILNVNVTDYPDDGVRASNPYLVPVGGDRFVLMWTQGEMLHYIFVDGTGALIGEEYEMEGQLSDCEPVVSDGKLYWYTWEEADIRFYSIDLEHPEQTEIVQRRASHEFEQTAPDAEGNVYDVCTKCGLRIPHDDSRGYLVDLYTISSSEDRWVQTRFHPETEYLETGDEFLLYIDKFNTDEEIFFRTVQKGEAALALDIETQHYMVSEFDAPAVLFEFLVEPLVYRNQSQTYRYTAKHNYAFERMQSPDGEAAGSITLKCADCGHIATFAADTLSGTKGAAVRTVLKNDSPSAPAITVLIADPETGEETAAEWGVDFTAAYVRDPDTEQSYAVVVAAKDSGKLTGSAVIPFESTQQALLPGDVNADDAVDQADAILLGKWLCCDPDAVLADWQAGDMNQDEKLNAIDLTLLKQALLTDRA